MTRPQLDVIPPAFQRYVAQVKDLDMLEALEISSDKIQTLLRSIPESKGTHRYAEGKWTIKELLNHMMDTERIFAYRALRFSRNDKTELPPFEENDYAPEANAHSRTIAQLAEEMLRLRQTTIDLYKSFTPTMLQREGSASKRVLSVFHLGYVIAGHDMHHYEILRDRYLKA